MYICSTKHIHSPLSAQNRPRPRSLTRIRDVLDLYTDLYPSARAKIVSRTQSNAIPRDRILPFLGLRGKALHVLTGSCRLQGKAPNDVTVGCLIFIPVDGGNVEFCLKMNCWLIQGGCKARYVCRYFNTCVPLFITCTCMTIVTLSQVNIPLR